MVEVASPCDGADVLVEAGEECIPLTTELATVTMSQVNNGTGSLGPFTTGGAAANCDNLAASITEGTKLVGVAAFFDSTLGDLAVETSFTCADEGVPPPPPVGLVAFPGDGVAALQWTPLPAGVAEGYHVHRALVSGGPYTQLTATPVADPSYHDTGLVNETPYFYVVTAVDAEGLESDLSAETTTTPIALGPTNVSGDITVDTTWTLAGSPYHVTGNPRIRAGATLTIEPAVEMRFAANAGLFVGVTPADEGSLQALGTAASPLLFTSDTAMPTAGHWQGLRVFVTPAGGTVIRHARIEGTGAFSIAALDANDAVTLDSVSIGARSAVGVKLTNVFGATLSRLTVEPGPAIGLAISLGDPVIDQADIAGDPTQFGVEIIGIPSAPTITGSTIANGIHIPQAQPDLVLSGNTFSDYDAGPGARLHASHVGTFFGSNTVLGATPGVSQLDVLGGAVDATATWPAFVYEIVSGLVDVASNSSPTLSIEAGATLRLPSGSGIRAGTTTPASLKITGTSTSPVLLTSSNPAPSPGDYRGIELGQFARADSIIDHTTVEFAGAVFGASLIINSSSPTVRDCTIRDGSGNGINLFGAGTRPRIFDNRIETHAGAGINNNTALSEITGNTITGNDKGIVVFNASPLLQIRSNDLAGNTTRALDNDDTNDGVDARLNWWGTPANPGSLLEGHVTFNPWLGSPPQAPIEVQSGAIHPELFSQSESNTSVSASLSVSVDWILEFTDGTPSVVRTFSGTGTSVDQEWAGDDELGTPLPDGLYGVTLSTQEAGGGAAGPPILGEVTLGDQPVAARITSPASLQVVAGDPVSIIGSAAGAAFSSYVLRYTAGVPSIPSAFTQFDNGFTQVNDGLLGTLGTATLDEGIYTLQLETMGSGGEQAFDEVTFQLLAVSSLPVINPIFSPNGDGKLDQVDIDGSVSIDADWTLRVLDSGSQAVRSFTGSGVNADSTWDGLDDAMSLLPDGLYSYEIEAIHPASGVSTSESFGTIEIDTVAPVVSIDSPAPGASHLIYDSLAISGTADDPNFGTYTLDYARPADPSSFLFINQGGFPVISGPLGTLPAGDPETLSLGNGNLTLRLRATDDAQNDATTTRVLLLDRLELTNFIFTPVEIDPLAGESSTLTWDLSHDANVTLRLYPTGARSGPPFVELATAEPRTAGSQTDVWDGTDGAANPAPETGYYASIDASDGLGRVVSYNDPADPEVIIGTVATPINRRANGLPIMTGLEFSAFRNDELVVTYDMQVGGYNAVVIEDGPPGAPATETVATIRSLRGVAPGSHVAYWDGRDSSGQPYVGPFLVQWPPLAGAEIPSVFVRNAEFRIADVRTHPYLFHPIHAQVTHLEYTLPTDATVEIDLIDPNGSFLHTLQTPTLQTPGTYTVDWDGKDLAGEIVTLEGSYTLEIRATEASSGRLDTRRASALVYR